MELHISNNEAAQLAYRLAQTTGHSVEEEVLAALRERILHVGHPQGSPAPEDKNILIRDLMAIAEHCSNLPVHDNRTLEEMLYDKNGMPK